MEQELPFIEIGLQDEEIKTFLEVYDRLKAKHSLCIDNFFEFPFSKFSLFENYESIDLRFAIDLQSNTKSYITYTQIEYTFAASKGGRVSRNEFQTWGMATLRHNFGHIIIKPETFFDKIQELLCPVELDFNDDTEFSKQFYVLSDDPNKAYQHLSQSFRTAILEMECKDFIIEIVGDKLLVGDKKPVNIQSANCFSEFLVKISTYH